MLREAPETYDSSSSALGNPKERLWDDQAGRPVAFAATGFKQLRFTPLDSLKTDHVEVDRLLIPRGHNLGNDRPLNLLASLLGDYTDGIVIPHVTGNLTQRAVPHEGLIDMPFLTPNGSDGFSWETDSGVSGDKASIGELWFTQTRQPTTGVAHEWEDRREPNLVRDETRSGNTYVVEQGEPRRVFTLEHQALSGADADLYDELLAAVRYGVHPFWYEHPDSGGGEVEFADTATVDGWGSAASDHALVSGSDGVANGALEITATSNGTATLSRDTASLGETTYFRDRILAIDHRVPTDASWVVDDADLEFRLRSTTPAVGAQTVWSFARGVRTVATTDWHTTYFDLEDSTSAAYRIRSADKPCDLGDVNDLLLVMGFDTVGQRLQIDNFRTIRKDSLPKLVELLGYERTQDSPAPLATGGTWRVRLQMREVLS